MRGEAGAGRCRRASGRGPSGRPGPGLRPPGSCAGALGATVEHVAVRRSTAPSPGAASVGRTIVTFRTPGPTTTVPPPLARRAIATPSAQQRHVHVVVESAGRAEHHGEPLRLPEAEDRAGPVLVRRNQKRLVERQVGLDFRQGQVEKSEAQESGNISVPGFVRISPRHRQCHNSLHPYTGAESMAAAVSEIYQHDHFVAQKQVFKMFGGAFRLKTPDGKLLAYSKQKAFKLKEDIRVYADEEMTQELLYIQADRVIDFSAAYRVTDSQSGEHIGSLRRKGWSSVFRDKWELLDPEGNVRGQVIEDSGWKAMARRMVDWAGFFLPQTYNLQVDDETVATMKQNFLGIPPKFTVDLSLDTSGRLPRPLAIATVILLLAIEGRQH